MAYGATERQVTTTNITCMPLPFYDSTCNELQHQLYSVSIKLILIQLSFIFLRKPNLCRASVLKTFCRCFLSFFYRGLRGVRCNNIYLQDCLVMGL